MLDVGCGPGDVTFLAARLVGPNGAVLGIDAAADIIDMARARAATQHLSHVSLQPGRRQRAGRRPQRPGCYRESQVIPS